MVDLGLNPGWPGSLHIPVILPSRWKGGDQEGKALRVSADLNPGHIKKNKSKETGKLHFVIDFIWSNNSKL